MVLANLKFIRKFNKSGRLYFILSAYHSVYSKNIRSSNELCASFSLKFEMNGKSALEIGCLSSGKMLFVCQKKKSFTQRIFFTIPDPKILKKNKTKFEYNLDAERFLRIYIVGRVSLQKYTVNLNVFTMLPPCHK